MEQNQSGSADDQRPPNDNRKARISDHVTKTVPPKPKQETVGQRWSAKQFSKTAIAWMCLAMIAGTMLVGFTWGGWVTGGSAQKTATTMTNNAVVQRLSSICVAQFQQDLARDEKLTELQAARSYEQRNFVRDQGWATMPGDEESDTKVATACAKALAQIE